MAWNSVPDAVRQLLDLLKDELREDRTTFVLSSMRIWPDRDNPGGLIVAAFDDRKLAWKYALFIREDGQIIADGY